MTYSISITFGDGGSVVATDGQVPAGTYSIAGEDTDNGPRLLAVRSDALGGVVVSADSAKSNGV